MVPTLLEQRRAAWTCRLVQQHFGADPQADPRARAYAAYLLHERLRRPGLPVLPGLSYDTIGRLFGLSSSQTCRIADRLDRRILAGTESQETINALHERQRVLLATAAARARERSAS